MKNFKKYTLPYIFTYYSTIFPLCYAQNTSEELGRVNIELSGIVTVATCGVLSAEQDKYISLGTIATKELSSIGTQSKPIAIPFVMSNCPPNGTVTLRFEGSHDTENNELLAIDTLDNSAENVAIEIRDKNKTRLALGKKSEPFIVDGYGKTSAIFYANYIVTKSQVKAGVANANIQFFIEYE